MPKAPPDSSGVSHLSLTGVDRNTQASLKTRDMLLQAAHDLFRSSGYEAVTIRDIVGRCDLSIGTFYNHFRDKEELLRRLFTDYASHRIPELSRDRRAAATLAEFVRTHFKAIFESICAEPAYFELFHRNAEVIAELASAPLHVQSVEWLRQDLEAAAERGLLEPTDYELLARAISGIARELGVVMVRRSPVDVEATVEFATQLVLNGLVRKS